MRQKIYIYLITLICLLIANTTFAQRVPGYQGKRLILKVDPFAPLYQKGIIVGFDYVVMRRMAFSFTYNRAVRNYTQRIANYKQAFGNFPEEKGQISDNQVGVEIQFYPNKSIPAPQGTYVFTNYYQGIAKASGHTFDPRDGDFLQPYTIENLRTGTLSAGVGNKSIAWDIVVLEFDFALTLGFLRIPEDTPELVSNSFQSFTDRYGPNIYSFGELSGNGGMGMTGHLKIGFLLF